MLKDFKSFVFVGVDVKALADAKFVSVDVKGVSGNDRSFVAFRLAGQGLR